MSEARRQHAGLIWIASYPKSGNTWTRAFLHNLLKVMEGDTGGLASINNMSEFTTWEVNAEHYERFLGKPPKEASRAEIAATRPKVQAMVAESVEGLAFVKTHNALVTDRGVPTINFSVTSGAIYIVRNPLDVAISYAHHMSRSIDQTIVAMATADFETQVNEKVVYEVYGSWSQHVATWTKKPHRAIYVMRYEDMLERPIETFGSLARHLLLTPSQEQLERAMELSSFGRLKQLEQEEGFVERPANVDKFFREGRSGQWREKLTEAQIRRITEAHAEQMHRFGYLPLKG